MNVYLVFMDNGYDYDNDDHWVEDVFQTYRGASQFLLDKGYTPFPLQFDDTNGSILQFEKEGGTDRPFCAWIRGYKVIEQ